MGSLIPALVLAGCQLSPPASSRVGAASIDRVAWPDECTAQPGYTQFIGELKSAVAQRDAAKLRSLFAADGRMRMNGIGGDRTYPDWGFDRPAVADIWPDLEEILLLGCASSSDRLYLPFMAAPGESSDGDLLIALGDTAIRSSPAADAPIVRMAAQGAKVQLLGATEAEGWAHVVTADGARGYSQTTGLRSPGSTMLVLVFEQGSWRIRWLGGNT